MADPIGKNQYGDDVYNTPNGAKTGTQISQELQAANWDGKGDPVSVYNQTAAGPGGGGGAGGGGGGGSSGGGGGGSSSDPYGGDYANYQNNSLLLQGANNAAQAAYNQGMLKFNNDKLAFDMATQAFNNAVSAAGLTGTFQGAPTIPAMQSYANLFGTWGVPTQGQQTLNAQNQGFNQQQALAQMYGQYYAPGQAPTAGQTTQAAQQQAYSQWLQAQQEARAQQGQQQSTAQAYLNMLAGLRGPADWIQYQKVLGATPGGLQDLVAAAAGQYVPGGGATTGVQPQAVTLQSFLNSATNGAFGAGQPGQMSSQQPGGQSVQQMYNQRFNPAAALDPNTVNWQSGQYAQPGRTAQPGQPVQQMYDQRYNPANAVDPNSVNWVNGNYAALNRTPGQMSTQPGGQAPVQQMYDQRYNPANAVDPNSINWASGSYATPNRTPNAQQFQGANAPGGTQQQAQATMNTLVAPNQMAPQTWANLTPSQQQMLLGTWEAKGYTKEDAQSLFTQSLPKYASQSAGAGSFRLQ